MSVEERHKKHMASKYSGLNNGSDMTFIFKWVAIGIYIVLALIFVFFQLLRPDDSTQRINNSLIKLTPTSYSSLNSNSTGGIKVSLITPIQSTQVPLATRFTEETRTPGAGVEPTSTDTPLTLPGEEALKQYMLQLINESRASEGLSAVSWDNFAEQVGQMHAEEMAINGYLSHWNLAGEGPDIRFSLAGGSDYSMENVYSSWQGYDNGTPSPIQDWRDEVRKAHEALMQSPGHRANIMDPAHTHVGIGMAYDTTTGEFRVAQEFTNHYIQMDPLPASAQPGETINITGQTLAGNKNILINLAFEQFPQAMGVETLNQPSSYSSPAQVVKIIPFEDLTGDRFSAQVQFGDEPGLYHIRIWIENKSVEIMAVDAVVWVGVSN